MRGRWGSMGMPMRKPSDQGEQIWLFPFFSFSFPFYFVVFVGESKQVVGLLDIALFLCTYQTDKITTRVGFYRSADHTAAKKGQWEIALSQEKMRWKGVDFNDFLTVSAGVWRKSRFDGYISYVLNHLLERGLFTRTFFFFIELCGGGRALSLDKLSSRDGTHARLGFLNCWADGLVTTGPFFFNLSWTEREGAVSLGDELSGLG